MGLRSALREFWDICGVLYMAPEAAAVHLEALRLRRLPPSSLAAPHLKPSSSVTFFRDGREVTEVVLDSTEPGQHMGRFSVKNSGTRSLRDVVIKAPEGMLLAWGFGDPQWHYELRRTAPIRVGESLSFVARASLNTIPGRYGGQLRVEEAPEPEWETYG